MKIPPLLELAHPLAESAQLIDLRLMASLAQFGNTEAIGSAFVMPAQIPQLSIGINVNIAATDDSIRFGVRLKVEPLIEGMPPFFTIEAGYVAAFAVANPQRFNSEQVQAFCEGCVIQTIWPFFREYVLSTSGRMGLPPVLLPLRKIDVDALAAQAAGQAKSRAKEQTAKKKRATRKRAKR